MVDVLEPDEVITLTEPPSEIDVRAAIDRLVKEGKLALPANEQALPILALGAAGGLLGATVLRGTVGAVAGGALAWWAWSKLSR